MKATIIGILVMVVVLGGLFVVTEGNSPSSHAPSTSSPASGGLSEFKIN